MGLDQAALEGLRQTILAATTRPMLPTRSASHSAILPASDLQALPALANPEVGEALRGVPVKQGFHPAEPVAFLLPTQVKDIRIHAAPCLRPPLSAIVHPLLPEVPAKSKRLFVVAALIASTVGLLTIAGNIYVGRKTAKDTDATVPRQLEQQRGRQDRAFSEQREQRERSLTEQRAQLNRTQRHAESSSKLEAGQNRAVGVLDTRCRHEAPKLGAGQA